VEQTDSLSESGEEPLPEDGHDRHPPEASGVDAFLAAVRAVPTAPLTDAPCNPPPHLRGATSRSVAG
jgi:hypothetical protein